MKHLTSRLKRVGKKAGFTLVELIVVIAVLAILAGTGTVAYAGYVKKANQAVDDQLVANIQYAARLGSVNDPEVKGRITLYTDKDPKVESTVTPDTLQNEYIATIGTWMEDAFGSGWESTMRLKTSGSTIVVPLMSQAQRLAAAAVNASGYADHTDAITGSVDRFSSILAGSVDKFAMLETLDSGYASFIKDTMGLDPTNPDDAVKIGNATVLYIAGLSDSMDSNQVYNALKTEVFRGGGELMTGLANAGGGSSVAGTALAYGATLGFIYSDYVTESEREDLLKQSEAITGITSMQTYLTSVTNNPNFLTYLDSEAGKTDVDGYLGAMSLVNEYQDSVDISASNAYSTPEIAALLEMLLGK